MRMQSLPELTEPSSEPLKGQAVQPGLPGSPQQLGIMNEIGLKSSIHGLFKLFF